MPSNKTLKYLEIIGVIWVLMFGGLGILAIGSGDGTTVPEEAFACIVSMFTGAMLVKIVREEKRKREHIEFRQRFFHMKGLDDPLES